MKNSNNYINIIGISLLIFLIGINEYALKESSTAKLIVGILMLLLGLSLVVINIKTLTTK